jgi:hypothetical protein
MPTVKNVSPAVSALGQATKVLLGESPIPANPVLVLGADESQQLEVFGNLSFKGKQSTKKLVETLYANGKRSHHFVGADEKDPDLCKFRSAVIAGIVKGYDADAQKIIDALPDSLSITQQALRKIFFSENISTDYGNIKKAMVRFEQGKLTGKTEKAKGANNEVMALRDINKAIKRLNDSKKPYPNIVEDVKALRSLAIFKHIKDAK